MPGRSVFLGQHDCQDTACDSRIAGIGGMHQKIEVKAVDFPEHSLALMLDAAEVAFAVWVVARIEVIEGAHGIVQRVEVCNARCDTLRNDDPAANEGSSSSIIQLCNAGCCHKPTLV